MLGANHEYDPDLSSGSTTQSNEPPLCGSSCRYSNSHPQARPIAGNAPQPQWNVKPLPGKALVLECKCCGSIVGGAIVADTPADDVRALLAARVLCPTCIGSSAKEHGIELSDRNSWEAVLRLMER